MLESQLLCKTSTIFSFVTRDKASTATTKHATISAKATHHKKQRICVKLPVTFACVYYANAYLKLPKDVLNKLFIIPLFQ